MGWDWDLTVALKGDGWGRQHFYTQSTQPTLYWGELQEATWKIQHAAMCFYTWACWQATNSGWSCPRWQDRKTSHGVTALMILGRAKRGMAPIDQVNTTQDHWAGWPGWFSSLVQSLAQGMILEIWDRAPHWAPCMEPASPFSCVSASLSLSLMSIINK